MTVVMVQQCDILGLRFQIHAACRKTIQLRSRFTAIFVLIALKNTGANNEMEPEWWNMAGVCVYVAVRAKFGT